MAKSFKRILVTGWHWGLDQLIEHYPAVLTVLFGGGGMSYLASISAILTPFGPVAWGAVGIMSMFIISVTILCFQNVRTKKAISEYTEKKHSTALVNVLAPIHQHERIDLSIFYHTYFRATQNARFENCELLGPTILYCRGMNFTEVNFQDCEVVIARTDRRMHGVTVFENCFFLKCHIYRVTFLMSRQDFLALPEGLRRGIPVISDGMAGDL